MPPPFPQLDEEEFSALLLQFDFSRRINIVHVHHTWRPNHAQYRGHASVESMWRYHTATNGWRDIAQHVSIGPEGAIWLGRNFNLPPASAAGHNGTVESGPFMIETIGDFDIGQDKLEEKQRAALIHVIAAVQRRFGLPHTAIMFHNMMSSKSCPGTSVAFNDLVEDVGSASPHTSTSRSFTIFADRSSENLNAALKHLSRETSATQKDESLAEHDAHDEFTLQRHERGGFEITPGLTTDMISALRPHVINLRGGKFSTDGQMTTSSQDVDAIINHLTAALATGNGPLRVVLYAHGGLVSESSGLMVAHKHLAWWKANHVYPINFIWETGFFETIGDLLKKTFGQGERSLGRGMLTDYLIEKTVRVLGMDTIWRGMKSAAEVASAPDGGAFYAVQKLKDFCDINKGKVELHAVGHSAGAIFHAHLLAACKGLGLQNFHTLQFLAPACRIDLFKTHVAPQLGDGVDRLTMFTMTRQYELDDTCAKIYGKSLLCLVSASAEVETAAPILGLEESLRADPQAAALFGLGGTPGPADVNWSVSSASASTSHGGFDDDPATLASVVRNVLGVQPTHPIVPYPSKDRGTRGSDGQDDIDWPAPLRPVRSTQPVAISSNRGTTQLSNRHALCIGINEYPSKPLSGCVADAEAWGAWFTLQGFDTAYLFNQQATANAIMSAIESLLSKAKRSDVVVIQFAGHGTQIADASGDEVDKLDEAWVPVNYLEGEFIIDDMLGELFDRHRDRGVELVVITDCCHSGTNTRAAFDTDSVQNSSNSRFLPVDPALQAKFNRRPRVASRSGAQDDTVGWEIHFAACQDLQSAYEENGRGQFSITALKVLARAVQENGTYASVANAIIQAFVNNSLQTPNFLAMSERRGWPLFSGGAAAETTKPTRTDAQTGLGDTAESASQPWERIERRLDELASLIRNRPI